MKPPSLAPVGDCSGTARPVIITRVRHGLGCVYMPNVTPGEGKARNSDEVSYDIDVSLRILPEVVIQCCQNSIRSQICLPLLEISGVFTRLRYLWILNDRFFEIPSNHAIGAFESIKREYAFDGIAKDANYLGSRDKLSYSFPGRRRSEISRGNFAHRVFRTQIAVVSLVPRYSAFKVSVEKAGLLCRTRQVRVLT